MSSSYFSFVGEPLRKVKPREVRDFSIRLSALSAKYIEAGLTDMSTAKPTRDESPEVTARMQAFLASHSPVIRDSILGEYARELNELICAQISERFHNLIGPVLEYDSGARLSCLMRQTIAGSGEDLIAHSSHWGVALADLAFFAVYLARPVRSAAAASTLSDRQAKSWLYGFCPTCGLWPRMARIDEKEGRLSLWCIGCNQTWNFSRLRCPFCLEQAGTKLGYLHDPRYPQWRVYVCETCRRYIKAVVSATATTEVQCDVDYLTTTALDMLGIYEGYVQDFVGFAAFDMQDNTAARNYRKLADS